MQDREVCTIDENVFADAIVVFTIYIMVKFMMWDREGCAVDKDGFAVVVFIRYITVRFMM